ncbi:MAG: riboflavin synthase [Actinobacteria bacterium]|nr:riboflavin synthase [Actinomycetota bacterium]
MFTGIVEELGRVRAVAHRAGGARLELACTTVIDDAGVGDSIAVNGCCLTVVELGDGWWAADAQIETLDRTTLGALAPGDPVNLERPLRMGDRLGGHLVLGHVDGVGEVTAVTPEPDGSTRVTVRAPAALARYLVKKGSVTVDGASLTITTVGDLADGGAEFGVALIPHTLAVTTLGVRRPGDRVNLEADMIAKHVERLLVTKE